MNDQQKTDQPKNVQQKTEQSSGARDQEIRAALDQHWAASDANDFVTEHLIYHEDEVLEYPQSGERTRGRHNIECQRATQPNKKRFTVRRIIGSGDLWVTEFVLTYDGKPSYTVSIMEFTRLRAKRSTSRIHSRLPHFALNGSSGWTHNIEARAAPGHHLDPSNQNGKDSPKKFALTSKGVPNGRHKWTEREHARDRACRVEHA